MIGNRSLCTSAQMTDPTTDPLWSPFNHANIPDSRGLFCKRSTDGKVKVNYWTCTLCGYVNEKSSTELVRHAKSRKHLKAIGVPNPLRNARKSEGDRAVHKLSSEVPNAAAEALENPPKGEKTQNESMSEATMQVANANTSVSTSERSDNEKVSPQLLGCPSTDGKIDKESKREATMQEPNENPLAITSGRVENRNVSAQVLGNPSTNWRNEIEPDKEAETQVPHAHAGAFALKRNTRNEPVEEETCFEENRARAGKYKCFRNFNLLCDPTKAVKKVGMDEDDDMDTSSDDDDSPLRKRFKPMTR